MPGMENDRNNKRKHPDTAQNQLKSNNKRQKRLNATGQVISEPHNQNDDSPICWNNLPAQVKDHIFSYLTDNLDNQSDLTNLMLVNRESRNLVLARFRLRAEKIIARESSHAFDCFQRAVNQQDFLLAHALLHAEGFPVSDAETELGHAVLTKDIKKVTSLLKVGVNPDLSCNFSIHRPLVIASLEGSVDIVKLLLAYGSDVCHQDSYDKTVLDRVKDLIANPPYLGSESEKLRMKRVDKIKEILEDCSCKPKGIKTVSSSLMQERVDSRQNTIPPMPPLVSNCEVNGCLLLATKNNDEQLARYLVLHNADINVQHDKSGCTPLMYACMHANRELVKFLLDHGADSFIKDFNGCTALTWAEQLGNTHIARLLTFHEISFLSSNKLAHSAQ